MRDRDDRLVIRIADLQMTNDKRQMTRLVKCPHNSGVHYFVWHCRELQVRGKEQCVECTAPDKTVTLTEVLFNESDG